MSELIEVYEIAEKACKETLIKVHGTLESGMARLGTRTFNRMILDVEAALEKHLRKEEFER